MKTIKIILGFFIALILVLGFITCLGIYQNEKQIATLQARIVDLGIDNPPPLYDMNNLDELPIPVQRYFNFTFRGQPLKYSVVRIKAEGLFRLPLKKTFSKTTAEQVIATGTPALMFSEKISIKPGLWASAYDFFAAGQMEMKAKILSTFTVVDQHQSPKLNEISLRRWLLESALYPQVLLPGGVVHWEPIDKNSAKAIVKANGLNAAMIAHFDDEGRMIRMVAEDDGDLSTPYHGSGEHVTRSDYRLVDNQMIPHHFTISRASEGKVFPFWKGHITNISFLK